MTSSIHTSSGVEVQSHTYETFAGLDSSRDLRSQDTGKEQHLSILDNGYCDWRGQIVRDPAATFRKGEKRIDHLIFYTPGKLAWAETTGGGVKFNTDDDVVLDVHPLGAKISSTVFNKKVHFCSLALPPYSFDGYSWTATKSAALAILAPAYATAVQRRMVVAGIPGRETEIHLSRVDNEAVFPDDERDDEASILRAGYINIANILGTADVIKGIASFEQNRLCVFTSDRCFVYKIDPDITQWYLDDRANINIGTISHNSVAQAGTDILFCSRNGVHSIVRSEDNGILVYSQSMSDKVELTYREMLTEVGNLEDVSAVFDQDEGQYHIFFPQEGGQYSKRLTLTMNPEIGGRPRWSTGSFINARSGAFLAGDLVYGTSGGVYDIKKVDEAGDTKPEMVVQTPILWCGSISNTKDAYSLVIQAQGSGVLVIDAKDENGRDLASMKFDVTPGEVDDTFIADVPLSAQYERKFDVRFRGVQLKFTLQSSGLFRLVGFAINTREPKKAKR